MVKEIKNNNNSQDMRKIKLHNYSSPDQSTIYTKHKTYRLWLGNEVTISKPSEKAIIAALTAVNDELNNYFAEINKMYIDLFSMYRRRWFILDSENNNQDNYKETKQSLYEVERLLDLISERSHYPNGNHFTFKHLNAIFDEFQKLIKIFIIVDTKKNNYNEIQSLKANLKRVSSIRKEMNSLGVEY